MCKSIKCFVPSQSLIPSRENISTTKFMIWWWKTKYKEKMYHKDICKWEQKNLLNFSVKNMYFGLCMSVYLSCLYIVILVFLLRWKYLLHEITFFLFLNPKEMRWKVIETNKNSVTTNISITFITRGKYSKFCVFHDEYKEFVTIKNQSILDSVKELKVRRIVLQNVWNLIYIY